VIINPSQKHALDEKEQLIITSQYLTLQTGWIFPEGSTVGSQVRETGKVFTNSCNVSATKRIAPAASVIPGGNTSQAYRSIFYFQVKR